MELLLIGRCPKYNKTASPLCFTSQSRVNHELITHPSAPYIYMYISRDFNNTPYTLHRPYRSYRPPHYSVLTPHYSLLTTHYSLLTTHYSLLTTHYSVLTTLYSLLTTLYCLQKHQILLKKEKNIANICMI